MLKPFVDPEILKKIQDEYKEENKEYTPEDNSYITTEGTNKLASWKQNHVGK